MARSPRFRSMATLAGEDVFALSPEESHHLLRVLRAAPGVPLTVFDSAGQGWKCELAGEDAGMATVRAVEPLPAAPASATPPLLLAVSAIKRRGLDLMIEKLSELGADELQLLTADRTVVDFKPGEPPERWERIALAAAKQSGRNVPLRVLPPVKLMPWIEQAAAAPERRAFAHFAPGAPSLGEWLRREPDAPPLIAIGPEGGWSPREAEAFAAAGFAPVGLGALTLRAETAAIAAAAAFRLL